MINLQIRDFEIELRNIISKSNLPIACVSNIVKNILFEIDILKEQQFIEELEQEGPPSNNSESFEETRTIYYNDEKQQWEDIEEKREKNENGTL